MNQSRYKGIECDQCGKPADSGLRLTFVVTMMYVKTPRKKHPIDDVQFYATFCSKVCMQSFLNRHYFESVWEIEEE